MPSRYAALTHSQLATLVPELLLCGHLIDRAGMAWCIEAWGREEMTQVAIEEWMGASPIYTARMQEALGFKGPEAAGDVITIFKGLQLDIGAPPQFMDFRYTVHDRWNGEFSLDHCGALMDVEPMGEDYVFSMCHDIEDPTFDATAVATNPRAQIRPIHRPPRIPVDRSPHCAWTVIIDEAHPEVFASAACEELRGSVAARIELDPIDRTEDGLADYAGPLVSDLDFTAFSHSALVRLADEVAIQMQLLNLSFVRALRQRGGADQTRTIATRQLVGIAGLTAGRLHRALGLPRGVEGAEQVLALHPVLNPAAYVSLAGMTLGPSPAHQDDGWLRLIGPDSIRPLQAIVRAVDPHLDVEVAGTGENWTARVVERAEPAAEFDEVSVTKFSTGAAFEFGTRRSLPIIPV